MTIVHCDWSKDPKKRVRVVARRGQGGQWDVEAPEPVGSLESFFDSRPTLAGFDFPIGLPAAYARGAGFASFPEMLPRFGRGEWSEFYSPAAVPDEISTRRPFYPRRPGGASRRILIDRLGLRSADDLRRRCDARSGACPIFWTLGGNQAGKGAIEGWRALLAPALAEGSIALWPFEGDFEALLAGERTVVAETYPAACYESLGVPRGFGKTIEENRARQAPAIRDWCARNRVVLSRALRVELDGGFPGTADDGFDALAGALRLIEIAGDPAAHRAPDDPSVRAIEGWIAGLPR